MSILTEKFRNCACKIDKHTGLIHCLGLYKEDTMLYNAITAVYQLIKKYNDEVSKFESVLGCRFVSLQEKEIRRRVHVSRVEKIGDEADDIRIEIRNKIFWEIHKLDGRVEQFVHIAMKTDDIMKFCIDRSRKCRGRDIEELLKDMNMRKNRINR